MSRRTLGSVMISTASVLVIVLVFFLLYRNSITSGYSLSPPVNTPFTIDTIYPFENAYFSGTDNVVYIHNDANNNEIVTIYKIDDASKTTISATSQAKPCFIFSGDNYSNSNYVCWYDFRNYTANEDYKVDIYYYNISNSTEYRLTTSPEHRTELSLHGDYLAFAEYETSNPGIYIKNLSSANPLQRIHSFTTTQCINFVLGEYNGDTVLVFEDQNGATSDIKMYNINTSTTTTIADSSTQHELFPFIQNGKIYFSSISRSNPPPPFPKNEISVTSGSLKEYTISSQTTSTICNFNAGEFVMATNNTNMANYVVYQKTSKNNNDDDVDTLYIYNPSTQSSTEIASQTGVGPMLISTENNCCYGNRIVYSKAVDSDGLNHNVYCYDASTNSTTTISSSDNTEGFARIFDNKIIWVDFNHVTSPTEHYEKILKGYIIQ